MPKNFTALQGWPGPYYHFPLGGVTSNPPLILTLLFAHPWAYPLEGHGAITFYPSLALAFSYVVAFPPPSFQEGPWDCYHSLSQTFPFRRGYEVITLTRSFVKLAPTSPHGNSYCLPSPCQDIVPLAHPWLSGRPTWPLQKRVGGL